MALNSIQYDKVMDRYSQKQSRNSSLLEHRRITLEAELPALEQLREKISMLSVDEARRRLSGLDPDPDFQENIFRLENSYQQLLIDSGYPADYLDPVYDCPKCKDTGFYNGQHCDCFHKEVANILLEETGSAALFQKESFATIREDYYSRNFIDKTTGASSLDLFQKAVKVCKAFVAEFDSSSSNLLLYGDTGVGKTFLCNCIAGELLKRGYTVIYMTSFQLFELLAKNHFSYDSEALPLAESVFECDLLVIDDLGTEMLNKFVVSELFTCVNERKLHNKATIISTNLSLDQVKENYTERIFSRIMSDYTLLKLAGDDIRIKKKLRQENR